jgi:long-chain fatty acid transport protein
VELPGIQVNGGLEGLNYMTFHHNQVTGDHNQSNAKLILIPAFYTTVNPGKILNDRLAVGVGVNSPFGLSSSFPSIGVGRYTGYQNALKTAATTIAGALRLHDKISVGAGAINYWLYDYGQTFNYPNAFILGIPGTPDGKVQTETNGFGWGWNIGAMIKPLPHHRLGFSYRSGANIKVHGRLAIEGLVLGAAQGFDTFPNFETGVHSDVSIPSNFTFAYAYEPSKKWAAEFDVGITHWDAFRDQDFDFDRPNAVLRTLGTIPRNYDTTWNFHGGGHYQISEKVDLQGGFFFYQAASPKKHVDNFLPDANRYGWTLGTSYHLGKRATIDLMYLFILFGRRHISNPSVLAKTGESIDGSYSSIIHGAMVSFTYRFDFPFEKRFAVKDSIAEAGVKDASHVEP